MKLVLVLFIFFFVINWENTGEFCFVSGGRRLKKAAQTVNVLLARGTSGTSRFSTDYDPSISVSRRKV